MPVSHDLISRIDKTHERGNLLEAEQRSSQNVTKAVQEAEGII
jgi:hypothetical protein